MTTPASRYRRTRRIGNIVVWVLIAWVLASIWPQSLHGNVAYVAVNGHSMDGTYHNGDLVVVRRHAIYRVGDIVAYRIPRGEFGAGAEVIHRIVGGNATTGYTTKGDNRTVPDSWHPRPADVIGTPWVRLPGMGRRMAVLTRPLYLGALCAGLTVFMMLLPERKPGQSPPRIPTQQAPVPVDGGGVRLPPSAQPPLPVLVPAQRLGSGSYGVAAQAVREASHVTTSAGPPTR